MIVRGVAFMIGYWPEGLEIPKPTTEDGHDSASKSAYNHFLAYLLSIIVLTTLGAAAQYACYKKPQMEIEEDNAYRRAQENEGRVDELNRMVKRTLR